MGQSRVRQWKFTVNAAGDPDACEVPHGIPAITNVEVFEETAANNYDFRAESTTSTAVTYPVGHRLKVQGIYYAGDVLGYFELSSGSRTFVAIGEVQI